MLLTDARRAARTGPDGELIPLTKQDRRSGIRRQIAEGVALITATLPKGSVGAYQLQAAIAAVHDEAARAEDTDWPQILALYDLLKRMSDNPMVTLNHAIAAPWCTARPRDWRCSTRSTPMDDSGAIIGSTPFAPICWSSPETLRPPRPTIAPRRDGRRTSRNEITS